MRSVLRTALHSLGALLAIAVLAVGTVVLVDAADGDFASNYQLVGMFPAAGQGLHAGSEVQVRGAQVGTVRSIALQGGKARIVLAIADSYRVPTDAVATIRSQNLFGAEEVSLSWPPAAHPAYLGNGGTIAHTGIEDELGQLFASAAPLLSQLDTNDLASLITELSQASQGEGPAIKASLDEGTHLADLLSATSTAQLQALDAFTRFTSNIASLGPAINGISHDSNLALPLFSQAAADYQSLLTDLAALSDHVSALISTYRPDIATILSSGGNVTRVLISDQSQLEDLIYGLSQYVYRFAHGGSQARLPDGSRFGFFKTFVEWTDVEKLICGVLAPALPGLSYLAPVQQAVASGSSPLDCSSEIAAFDRAQQVAPSQRSSTETSPPAATAPRTTVPSLPPTVKSLLGGLGSTAKQLTQSLYADLAAPQSGSSAPDSIGSYVEALLGAA